MIFRHSNLFRLQISSTFHPKVKSSLIKIKTFLSPSQLTVGRTEKKLHTFYIKSNNIFCEKLPKEEQLTSTYFTPADKLTTGKKNPSVQKFSNIPCTG